jgi:hypothetical protein
VSAAKEKFLNDSKNQKNGHLNAIETHENKLSHQHETIEGITKKKKEKKTRKILHFYGEKICEG